MIPGDFNTKDCGRTVGDGRAGRHETFPPGGGGALVLCAELQGNFGQGQDGTIQGRPPLSAFGTEG